MNVFVTEQCPYKSAEVLPDKHIVKMPLETCQMLAVVYSKWYFNWGDELLHKKDGSPYNTKKGAFRGHPCTVWAAEDITKTAWLIAHGVALCYEYWKRYDKIHSCSKTIQEAREVFTKQTKRDLSIHRDVKDFAFAGLMSSSMIQVLISLLNTRNTLHPNLGSKITIFAYQIVNLIGYHNV